jgi:nucleoside phosphorylase
MEPWLIDAQESIQEMELFSESAVERTIEIVRFLESDKRHFVVATKGFGKSLVLLNKRSQLTKKNFRLVPHGVLLDTPGVEADILSREAIELMDDNSSFVALWSIALLIPAIRASYRDDEPPDTLAEATEPLPKLFSLDACRTVSGTLNVVLSLTRKDFIRLRRQYGTVLMPLAREAPREVGLFIDNVDEGFQKTPFWQEAQAALIEATFNVGRLNPKIAVFTSIRREAWRKFLSTTAMSQQYEGACVQLGYDKSEMLQIFERNIRADHDRVLADVSCKRSDPVRAFVGDTTVRHAFADDVEDVFDYIYRHTLRRPRDLMQIGRAISRVPVADRQLDTAEGIRRFRDAVNDAGTLVCDEYLKEIEPHLDLTAADVDRLCSMIPRNVLTAQEVKSVCGAFNGRRCEARDCRSCECTRHIFCDLYRAGLIGVVRTDAVNGELVQEFPQVGDGLFVEGNALPKADHYLVHPVLNDRIKSKNPSFAQAISKTNIIGFDRPWVEVADEHAGVEVVALPQAFTHADFAVLAVREDEHRAILSHLGEGITYAGENRTYTLHEVRHESGRTLIVGVVRVPRPGQNKAQSTARSAIQDLTPTWLVLQGIAGATPDTDFCLGDVIVGSHLHSFTVAAAKSDGKLQFEDEGGHMTPRAEDLIAHLPALERTLCGWEALEGRPRIDLERVRLYGPDGWQGKVVDSLRAAATRQAPIALMRGIASAPFLVKDADLLAQWQASARDIAAVEMELAGVYEAARRPEHEYPVLAIRAISDIVGLEREDPWTRYAARAAASYTAKLIARMPVHFLERT